MNSLELLLLIFAAVSLIVVAAEHIPTLTPAVAPLDASGEARDVETAPPARPPVAKRPKPAETPLPEHFDPPKENLAPRRERPPVMLIADLPGAPNKLTEEAPLEIAYPQQEEVAPPRKGSIPKRILKLPVQGAKLIAGALRRGM